MNAFYRNRLVRCFLGATRPRLRERQPQNFTGFDDLDDLPLCELLVRDEGKPVRLHGPLPILNCALNLGGAGDLSLHTRQSASFTLTPFRAGSDYRHEDIPDPGGGRSRARTGRPPAGRLRRDDPGGQRVEPGQPRPGHRRLGGRRQPEHGLPHVAGGRPSC